MPLGTFLTQPEGPIQGPANGGDLDPIIFLLHPEEGGSGAGFTPHGSALGKARAKSLYLLINYLRGSEKVALLRRG